MAVNLDNFWQIRRDEQEVASPDLDGRAIDRRTKAAVYDGLLSVHTAIPGIIDSFDSEKQTVTVRPALKTLYAPDPNAKAGETKWVDPDLLVDVPVLFPGNADYMLTFPVGEGDECLLVFNERCIDDWFTKGDVQEQAELRNHDKSDAIAIVGLRSQPNKIEDFDEDNLQLRNADGDTFVTLDKDGTITITAADDTTVTVDDGTITAEVDGTKLTIEDGTATVKATNIKLDGKVEITGTLTGRSTATFTGDVHGQGKSLATHVHPGVQGGPSTTGPPA